MDIPEDSREPRAWRLRDRLAPAALEYQIPPVATQLPYFLGALTLTSIVLVAGTGIYLSQLYDPSPIGAHGSVIYIVERALLGDLARSLHWWSAQAAILAVLFHLSWVFYRGSYRAPRELTYFLGRGRDVGVPVLSLLHGDHAP